MAYGEGLRRNRCGIWHWRWVVPDDLRGLLGRHEVSCSLGTASRREAVGRALQLRLTALQMARLARRGAVTGDGMRRALREAKQSVDRLERAAEHEAEFVEAHEARIAAVTELHEAKEAHAVELTGVYIRAASVAASQAVPARVRGPALSACVEAFMREGAARGNWTDKTRDRQRFTLRCLVECLGDDRPIGDINREQITQFLERLRRMPTNAQKKAALKGKTFNELTALTGYPVLGDQTVSGHMTRVAGFFKWSLKVDGYGLTKSPAEGFSLPVRDSVKRTPFSRDQLRALFGHEDFSARKFLHPHHFWLMPIAALTGMRLNEICQLSLSNFVTVDGVEVIECADLGDGRRAKTASATRRVPIHDELIRLGLLRWVQKARQRGESQLFPELKAGRDGHGQAASKWFGRYRERCGVVGGQQVFHSFRHGFISALHNRGVPEHFVAAIVGHEVGTMAGDVYWNDRNARALQAAVNEVRLPESVMELIPVVEEVTFKAKARRVPSRLGARKSRENRIRDAAARKAARARPGAGQA